MSWKASASAERLASLAGISPATMRQKRQSAMQASESRGGDHGGGGEGRRLEAEGVRGQGERPVSRREQQPPLGFGETTLGTDDDGHGRRVERGRRRRPRR